MTDFDVQASLQEALSGTDALALPASLAADWEMAACLGRSEHCETILLRSRTDGSRAVVKLLDERSADAGVAEKLLALDHPGLPRVMSVCRSDDRLWVLREYIAGEPLTDHGCRFSEEETIRIALQLCDILSYLHGLTPPLIHRDVKPENILLRPDGSVVLIDFGIARLYSESGEKDTRVMGTEHFAPPEQYGFRQTDRRSDLYALGMVMGWMLTGSVRSEEHAAIPSRQLRKIISRCSAFSPEDRYASAGEVKKALLQLRKPGRTLFRIAAALCCLVLLGVCMSLWQKQPEPVVFEEPLIEQAVRLTLGLSEDEPLTAEHLAAVEGIYIFADAVCADQDGFYTSAGNWYASGTKARGPITRLTDVSRLPNLRYLMIAANHITDLAPLSALTGLEKLECKHNSITDISPLKGLTQLVSVGLNDNPMTDVSALSSLPNLRYLDLCDASAYDPAGLDGLGDMEMLNISNRTDSWRYLGEKQIRDLRLGWTGIDSLAPLAGITGVAHLEIEHTQIRSLSGISDCRELTYLRLSGCEIADLSPLPELPKLETLVIDETLRTAAEALGPVRFQIRYE